MLVSLIVDGKAVDNRLIPDRNFKIPGYLEGLKQAIIEENEDIIDLSEGEVQIKIRPAVYEPVLRN